MVALANAPLLRSARWASTPDLEISDSDGYFWQRLVSCLLGISWLPPFQADRRGVT